MSFIATTFRGAMCALEEEKTALRPTNISELKLKTQVIKLSRGQVELKHQVAVLSKEKKRLEARIDSLLKVVASHGAIQDQMQLQLDAQAAETARQVAALQDAFLVEHGRAAKAFEQETARLKEQLALAKKLQEEALQPCSVAVATEVPTNAVYTLSPPTIVSSKTKVADSLRAAEPAMTCKLEDSTPTTPPSRKRSANLLQDVSPRHERRVRRKQSVEWTIDFLAL